MLPEGEEAVQRHVQIDFDVNMIFGSNRETDEGQSPNARKHPRFSGEVTFGPSDATTGLTSSSEALVIQAVINKNQVARVCIDNGSAVNILYGPAFREMKINPDQLTKVHTPLYGFAGPACYPVGSIRLLTTVGEGRRGRTLEFDYLVVNASSPYNVILGRPALYDLRAVISTFHNSMKFPTIEGTYELKGDLQVAQICSTVTVDQCQSVPSILVEELIPDEQDEKSWISGDIVESVQLWDGEEDRRIQLGAWIPTPEKEKLIALLKEFKDVFAWKASDMPGLSTDIAVHKLEVDPTRKPVKQKKRSFASDRLKAIEAEVGKLLTAGIVKEVLYPKWIANPVLVKKPDGSWRMCVDFTDLNKACPKDSYPLPKIDRLVDSTVGYEVFGFLDAYKGYHQILMDPSDAEKTAFITEFGTFCYITMPFGLKNAGATYQRAVNKVFQHQIGRCMEVYVDDLLIKSTSIHQYLLDVREVFEVLRETRMKLNPQKCTFGVRSGKFLGYMISKSEIRANPDKINLLKEMPAPRNIKEVQRLTGRMAALNRFLSRSAQRALPFFKILRKANPFHWDEECQAAFEELKTYLSELPTITSPRHGETLFIYLSTCAEAVSAVLVREEKGIQTPIYFVSKALHGPEERYSPTEKLVLSLIHASRKLRTYFQAHPIVVVTDQPLKQILAKPDASGRLSKWVIEMAQFDIDFTPRTAIKAQALADFIAEGTSIQLNQDKSDANDMWTLHVDGASSKEGSGAGLLLLSPKGEEFPYALRFDFKATNNEAEYEAMITGLKLALKLGVDNLHVFSDSQLVINHIKGEYEAKEDIMKRYLAVVEKLVQNFRHIQFEQVPRSQNKRADALSKLASNFMSEKRVLIESLSERSYMEVEAQAITQQATWMDHLVTFLRDGVLPEDKIQARKIKLQAARYTFSEGTLCRKSFLGPWLKCIPQEEGKYLLEEIHRGACGNHCGARTLARKSKLAGFYWPTMGQDAIDLVRTCPACQKHDSIPRQQAQEMNAITSAWPFDLWGVDIVGPLPRTIGRNRFVIVAVDYFTRWVEAKPVTNVLARTIKKFLWKDILCRYGIPRAFITDNGTQFEDRKVKKWCDAYNIKQKFTAVAHAQANGQVEHTNRQIKAGIRKRLEDEGRDWENQLPSILWSYRTAPNSATGETPFSLVYGCKAVIPAEICREPSPRVLAYGEKDNEIEIRHEKDELEEKRDVASARTAKYKQKISQYYNSRVRHQHFKVGDWVLRKNEASRQENQGALGPNWEGPYRVLKVNPKGSYQLGRADGTTVPRYWHSNNLRRYYA